MPIPSNLVNHMRLSQVFRAMGQSQARLILSRNFDSIINGDIPDLNSWIDHTVAVAKPILLNIWQSGMMRSYRRVSRQPSRSNLTVAYRPLSSTGVGFGKKSRQVTKEFHVPEFQASFNLFRPEVLTAVQQHTFILAQSTIETSTRDLNTALEQLRRQFKAGLSRGDAIALLAKKVREIFANPYRSYMIAATETSRFMHGGALMVAMANPSVIAKEWLASSDACPKCLKLHGKQVDLDKPFWVDPDGGYYAVVMYPPLHPHCFCDFIEVL